MQRITDKHPSQVRGINNQLLLDVNLWNIVKGIVDLLLTKWDSFDAHFEWSEFMEAPYSDFSSLKDMIDGRSRRWGKWPGSDMFEDTGWFIEIDEQTKPDDSNFWWLRLKIKQKFLQALTF